MATRTIASIDATSAPPPAKSRLRSWILHLCSFETVFVLFLNSDSFEILYGFNFNTTLPLLAASMGLGILAILRDGIYPRGLRVVAAFLMFLSWIVISYSWTPSVTIAQDRLNVFFLLNFWTVLAGALVLANSRERMVRFLVVSLVVGTFIALNGLQIIIELGTVQKFSDDGRAHISWGRTVGPAVLVAFAIVLFARPFSKRQLVGVAFLLVNMAYLVSAGGRGPFLAVGVAMMIPFALGFEVSRRTIAVPRFQLLGFAALLLVAGALAVALASGEEFRSLDRLLRTLEEDPSIVSGAARLRFFPGAYNTWLEAPLLGNGIGSFSIMFLGYEQAGAYPHNIILELLTELGIVGLVIFIGFAWTAASQLSLKRLRADPMLLAILMLLVMAMMNAMVSSNLGGNRLVYLFLAMLALRPPDGRKAD